MARILVVEDEPDLQKVLEYNLKQAGHEVTVAGRGSDGLRTARQLRPELVLLDLMLPDLPGTDVCKDSRCVPDTWTCNGHYYDHADGCDCNCGAPDPDCDLPNMMTFGCQTGQTCVAGVCQ